MGSVSVRPGVAGNRYCVRTSFVDPSGRRRFVRETFATESEALARLAEVEGRPAGSVGAWLDQWLVAVRPTVRVSTYVCYERLVRLYLRPTLGPIPLVSLSATDLQPLYTRLGARPAVLANVHIVLTSALGAAVRAGLVARNVAHDVQRTRYQAPVRPVWTADQVARFLAVADQTPDGLYFRLVASLGLRRSEAAALQWGDVDLGAGTVTVNRTLSRVEGSHWVVAPPKTGAGRRVIPLPAACRDGLSARLTGQAAGDWIFPNPAGQPYAPETWHRRFASLVRAAGLPPIRLHGLRHTVATLMLQQGTNPKVVSVILGHASVAITLAIYTHVRLADSRQAIDSLAGLIG